MSPAEHRDARRRLGVSQAELAERMETTQQVVSEIERGVRPPPARYEALLRSILDSEKRGQ